MATSAEENFKKPVVELSPSILSYNIKAWRKRSVAYARSPVTAEPLLLPTIY